MNSAKKILTLFSFFLLTIFFSCSAGSDGTILNFLFDGVPAPDTLKIQDKKNLTTTQSIKAEEIVDSLESVPSLFYHLPYEEKMCSDCHDQEASNKKIMSQPELCYQCHSDFQSEFEYIHYPVEAGECNSCHHPHKSTLKMLLIKPIRELCGDCHDLDELLSGDMHSGIGDIECTDCHYPHGSNDVKLLK